MASRASAKLVRVLKSDDKDFSEAWARVCSRGVKAGESIDKEVAKIIARVREEGDSGLIACVKKYDGPSLDSLEVTR